MNKLKTLEDKLGSVFNIMALIRTLVCIIFFICALASCTVEYAYSEASYDTHQIHWQENMDMPNCQWCIDYNTITP